MIQLYLYEFSVPNSYLWLYSTTESVLANNNSVTLYCHLTSSVHNTGPKIIIIIILTSFNVDYIPKYSRTSIIRISIIPDPRLSERYFQF